MTFKIQDTNGEGLPDFTQDDLPLADITVYLHDSLMIANHNYPCPLCKGSAVYVIPTGIFQPCLDCQKKGYKIVKVNNKRSWFSKLFK